MGLSSWIIDLRVTMSCCISLVGLYSSFQILICLIKSAKLTRSNTDNFCHMFQQECLSKLQFPYYRISSWPIADWISHDEDRGDNDDDDDDHVDVDDDDDMWWWCKESLAEHYLLPWESSFLPVCQYLDRPALLLLVADLQCSAVLLLCCCCCC